MLVKDLVKAAVSIRKCIIEGDIMELRDIVSILAKRFITITVVVLIFMLLGAIVSVLLIVPLYETNATLIVNKTNVDSTSTKDYTYNDILLTQKLVDTYNVIITSDTVINEVISNLNLNMTVEGLRKMINVTGVNDTEIIKINVTDSIPERAANIANEITRVGPQEIMRTVKAGSVELIDFAVVPAKPVSPNITNNILISGLLGFAIISIILIAREYFNKTVKTPEDVELNFNLPVVGQIPKFRIGRN
jgi:capsular polysaccharide biosynthesis protein